MKFRTESSKKKIPKDSQNGATNQFTKFTYFLYVYFVRFFSFFFQTKFNATTAYQNASFVLGCVNCFYGQLMLEYIRVYEMHA